MPAVTQLPSNEERWAAVLARDARADGRFVFAVRSTRIYCRPSCPSRRPRADRVAFFESPAHAERAGYRPCRRCHPRDAPRDPLVDRVRLAAAWLDAHADQAFTLDGLSRTAGCSPSHLQRAFTRVMGVSPREYQARLRVERLKGDLRRGSGIADATFGAGFGSSSRLYEAAGRSLGMTPGAYKRGGHGEDVWYVLEPCSLGVLLVARTTRGICTVKLGDSPEELCDELAREYPRARVSAGDPSLGSAVRAIVEAAEGNSAQLRRLPLDLRGTAFQQRVWKALMRIPSGRTHTYGEVARQIGSPGAVRAVAAACAANPVALIVPCHRVVPKTGGTGGYRWGPDRKQRLLERERGARRREWPESVRMSQSSSTTRGARPSKAGKADNVD